jgi:hypothetical protein
MLKRSLTRCLKSSLLVGAATLIASGGAFASVDIAPEVKEAELHDRCDLRPDQVDDEQAQRDCAVTCFTGAQVAAAKAAEFHARSQTAYLGGLLIALAACAVAAVVLMRKAGRQAWTSTRLNLSLLLWLALSFGAGTGAAYGLHNVLAWNHGQNLYKDMLLFKRAGKTGESTVNNLSCRDLKLKQRIDADVASSTTSAPKGSVTAIGSYTGIVTHFEPTKELQGPQVDERWADYTEALQAANAIDPARGVSGSFITDSPFYELVSGTNPFPFSPLIAGLVGAFAGLIVGFVVRRLVAR